MAAGTYIERWSYQGNCDTCVSRLDEYYNFGEWGSLSSAYSESNQGKTETVFVNITTPNIFGIMIFFHCFSVFNSGLKTMTLMEYKRREYREELQYVQCLS